MRSTGFWSAVANKPEEIVRQRFIRTLIEHYGYSVDQMDQQRRIQNGHWSPRADIVIWASAADKAANPHRSPAASAGGLWGPARRFWLVIGCARATTSSASCWPPRGSAPSGSGCSNWPAPCPDPAGARACCPWDRVCPRRLRARGRDVGGHGR
ncbi:MAG: hypothetical protein EOM91_16295 [Sphingobacteriia bacterium]|nr:hypothetical protein [Sphingobacteriia bacterium]NCC41195.1 hypothetical protein [Gammaproteobacteria bacterium]